MYLQKLLAIRLHKHSNEIVAEDTSNDLRVLKVRRQVVRCQFELMPLEITFTQGNKRISLGIYDRDHVSAKVYIPYLFLEVKRLVRFALEY